MTFHRLPLRRVARIVNGGTPPPDEANWGGDVSWATPVDIGAANGTIEDTKRTLTRLGAIMGSTIVPSGSILVSTRAPIGYVARTITSMAFNQGCKAVIPSDRVDPRFIYYQLSSLSSELNRRGLGTTFLELSADSLASVEITLPKVEEQRRIADFLDAETTRIDALSAHVGRAIDLVEARRIQLILEVIEPRTDGLASPTVPLKYLSSTVSVGIVITPARWYVDGGGVIALRGLNIRPGSINLDDVVQISHEGHALHSKSKLHAGDIVVVRTGQAGVAAVVPPSLNDINCIDLVIVRPISTVIPKYLEVVLNSEFTRKFINESSVGSIQPHLNVAALKQLPLPLRDLHAQLKVVDAVEAINQQASSMRALMSRQLGLLAERRQALITAAVTGQFDVTTALGADLS